MMTKKEELQAELTRLNALRKHVKERLKALPVLDVGKWCLIDCEGYYSPTARNAIVYDNGEDYSYGFDFEGKFINDFNLSNCRRYIIRELTPKEVEQALIEEAKKRGYKEGVVVKPLIVNMAQEEYTLDLSAGNFYESKCRLYVGRILVFNKGEWATIIEQDKFAELKEAHKNGAKIQCRPFPFNNELGWVDDNNPSWSVHFEYRIKPEEKPKVGDVVKAWDNESDAYTVGKVIEIDSIGYFLQDDLWWDNAKTITKQEAIDLLFNKGAN